MTGLTTGPMWETLPMTRLILRRGSGPPQRRAEDAAMAATSRLWMLAAALVASTALGAGRPTCPLDGAWQFRLDRTSKGEAERWFDPGVTFQDTISVPGA